MEIEFSGEVFTFSIWIIWVLWTAVALIYGIFSAILVYHWKRYGFGNSVIKRVAGIYFFVTGPLLVGSFIIAIVLSYV